MMERQLIETSDGSHSLFVPALNEQYHSRHGALQESRHVFLKMGWEIAKEDKNHLRILEIGFGTGLNALLTALVAQSDEVFVEYVAVEAYPVESEHLTALNYAKLIDLEGAADIFDSLHAAKWNSKAKLSNFFELEKLLAKIEDFDCDGNFDLVYFDAFAPEKQVELWTLEIFEKMLALMSEGGRLVTYCAKGVVRRTMIAAGFEVQKVPGPPGKREMLVAIKKSKQLSASEEI